MDNARFGEVVVLVTTLYNPVRQVDILAVHKKVLVQQAHFVQSRAAQQHKGASKHIYLIYSIFAQMPHIVLVEPPRFREQARQPENLVERHHWRRETALAFRQIVALAVNHLHAKAARVGVLVHKFERLAEGVFLNQRVGVEQQHIFARRLPDCLIVGNRKARVLLVLNQFHLRKLFGHHCARAVNRVVVDYKNLCVNTLRGLESRVQALLKKVFHVVVDNNDRKFHPFSDLLRKYSLIEKKRYLC